LRFLRSHPLYYLYLCIFLLTCGIAVNGAYFFVTQQGNVFDDFLYKNTLEITLDQLQHTWISADQLSEQKNGLTGYVWTGEQSYEDYFVQVQWQWKGQNVIFIFGESLSFGDSWYASKTYTRFPKLDLIQQAGITYTNMMSNGCTSDVSHIAVLQWVEPRNYGYAFWQKLYDKYHSYVQPLPAFLQDQWYKTEFVSTAPIDFLGQDEFLDRMGFDTIVWPEAFSGQETYTFDAAPDKALFERIAQDAAAYSGTQPFFVAAQTISLHKPFATPYWNTEDDAFTYADDAMYELYQQLLEQKFFDNWILVIVWDHRKMQPLDSQEFQKWGRSAYWRVIATVIGTGIAPWQTYDAMLQHTDIHHSLKQYLASGQVTIFKNYTDMFTNTSQRDRFVRYCDFKEKEYIVTRKDGTIASQDTTQTPDSQSESKAKLTRYIQAYEQFQLQNMSRAQWEYGPTLLTWMSGSLDRVSLSSGSLLVQNVALQADDYDHVWHGLSWVMLIGHGGAPAYKTYNSLEWFFEAYRQWADAIELDLSLTKDRVNVVWHGPDIWSPACRGINFADRTLEQIQTECLLGNDEVIMTFDDVLQKTKAYVPLYIVELKVRDDQMALRMAKQAVQSVKKAELSDKVVFITYNERARLWLGTQSDIRVGRDTFDPQDLQFLSPWDRYEYFMTPMDRFTKDLTQQIFDIQKIPVTYTPKTTWELLDAYETGVRAFMVDDIPWAIRVLSEVE